MLEICFSLSLSIWFLLIGRGRAAIRNFFFFPESRFYRIIRYEIDLFTPFLILFCSHTLKSCQWHMQTTSCECFHSLCTWLEMPLGYSFGRYLYYWSARTSWRQAEKSQSMLTKADMYDVFPPHPRGARRSLSFVVLINSKNVSRYLLFCFPFCPPRQCRWNCIYITLPSELYASFNTPPKKKKKNLYAIFSVSISANSFQIKLISSSIEDNVKRIVCASMAGLTCSHVWSHLGTVLLSEKRLEARSVLPLTFQVSSVQSVEFWSCVPITHWLN